MADIRGFKADQYKPRDDFSPLPKGVYKVVAIDSDWKDTLNKKGQYLQFQFEVVDDGEYKGRYLWDRLNLKNPNQQAMDIANSAMAELCMAVGKPSPDDSMELHNIPLLAHVDVEERNDKPGSYTNRINKYEPIGTAQPVQATIPTTPNISAPAPWAK